MVMFASPGYKKNEFFGISLEDFRIKDRPGSLRCGAEEGNEQERR